MLATLVALALAAPGAPEEKEKDLPEAAQKELKKFEGMWKAVTIVTGQGEETPMKDGTEVLLEIKGRKFLLGEAEIFTIPALDPSTDPKCIDLKATNDMGEVRKGDVYEGIYKFDGDTLVIALNLDGKSRPAKFEAEKDSKVIVATLKKEKK
jgi:uncharacterized protein (TIGR03067 family)